MKHAAPTILCIGDSITGGYPYNEPFTFLPWAPLIEQPAAPWPYILHTRLPGWIVLNIGVSGNTSGSIGSPPSHGVPRDVLSEFAAYLNGTLPTLSSGQMYYQPDYVVFMAGVNDINHFYRQSPAIGDPVAFVTGNVETVCDVAVANDIIPVCCTVTPFVEDWGYDGCVQMYIDAVNNINAWVADYTEANGFNLIDFYDVLDDPNNPGRVNPALSSDGIAHPNVAGYSAMGNSINLDFFETDFVIEHITAICEIKQSFSIPVGYTALNV